MCVIVAHIYTDVYVCLPLSACARTRVPEVVCAVCFEVKVCVKVCVHVRVFETWGCVTSLYAQPLWLTPSPVAPYSGSLPVGTTQPVVEEGRWTEELGSSCQFSFFLLRRVCLLSEKSINEIFKDKKDEKMFTGPHGRGSLYSLLLMLLLNNYQWWLLWLLLLLFLVFLFLLLIQLLRWMISCYPC